MGYSVTIQGETRVVSAYTISGMSPAGASNYGEGGIPLFTVSRAFSFTPTNAMTFTLSSGVGGTNGLLNKWGFKQLLIPAVPSAADFFGFNIAVCAGLLVVGAPGVDVPRVNLANDLTDAGAVYTFRCNRGVSITEDTEQKKWTEDQRLTQTSDLSFESVVGTRLGTSVAVSRKGDTIIAGGPSYDTTAYRAGVRGARSQAEGVLPSAGSVVIFRRQVGNDVFWFVVFWFCCVLVC